MIYLELSLISMKKIKAGDKYNRLVAIKFDHKNNDGKQFWLFKCDCGNEKIIETNKVKSGHTKSCGCLRKEIMKKNRTDYKIHGMSEMPTYGVWEGIKGRCLNKNSKAYKNYGARGITICKRWMKFENFYEDMGKKPKDLTLDRIDNNKGYCKENCRWATKREQANNRRDNVFASINGVQIPFTELAEMFGLKRNTLYERLYRYNWSLEKSLLKLAKYNPRVMSNGNGSRKRKLS